ncbi:hypothetical protein [Sphingomonas oryzagri]
MKISVAAVAGVTLLVTGCNRHQEPVQQEQVQEAPRPAAPTKPAPKPAPVAATKPVVHKAKPLPPTPAEQQVLDDADATGMTARTDRSGGGDDENAPADTNRQQ